MSSTLAGLVSGLSEEQRRALARTLREREREKQIRPGSKASHYPASFTQRRLWFLHQMDPGTHTYNSLNPLRIEGPLEVAALRRVFTEILRRHEILRTVFAEVDGEPVQVVRDPEPAGLDVTDISNLSEQAQGAEEERLLREDAFRPFDLEQGPLFRFHLVRRGADNHVLLMTMHHSVCDGWSAALLKREIAVLYEAFSQGRPSPLPEPEFQYRDYATWQQTWVRQGRERAQIEHWRKRLAGAPELTDLPLDRPRPAIRTSAGATRTEVFPAGLLDALKGLSQKEEATLFMTLLAGFKALLHRYRQQDEIVIGVVTSGRNRSELEEMAGVFINTLPLRTRLSGNPSFRELLGRVREATLDGLAHQDLAFERLVSALQPKRNPSHAVLFQVLFLFQNIPTELRSAGQVRFKPLGTETGTAKYDLTLSMGEREGRLRVAFEYSTEIFDDSTIQRMIADYRNLLEAVAGDPGLPVQELPPCSQAELPDCEGPRSEYPGDQPFASLFEAQAAKTPERIAATDGAREFTYRALSERADRIAGLLKDRGAAPEKIVALYLERSIDFLAAMLAVFKTGAAYLPLDPGQPAERTLLMLGTSQANLVLTTSEAARTLQKALTDSPLRPELILLETASTAAPARPVLRRHPDNLAYVIFTSGSTGVPKGAMITCRGMLNHLYAKIRDLEITAADRMAQTASQCFDISVWQFLAPLLVGACVDVFDQTATREPDVLFKRVEHGGITLLETVPSLLRVMLSQRALNPGQYPQLASLRCLIATGEALPPELCRDWFDAYPHVPIVNAYGPTECSDDVTHFRLSEPLPKEADGVPLGRPIANTRIYICDEQLRRLPAGAPGWLYVAGDGVGRGYINDPGRTAAAFLPDPFSGVPGARMYATGDRARFSSDGNIWYLGRGDGQVKIRGVRIELGEIESALRRFPGVREAVAVATGPASGDPRLIAFVTCRDRRPPDTAQLHQFVAARLPSAFVPSQFTVLDRMPLTSNGKVDRRALATQAATQNEAARDHDPPRTEIEATVAAIWAQALGLECVGRNDNFFEIGGHSLLAVQVIARIRAMFRTETPLRVLFQAPSPRELAKAIEQELSHSERGQDSETALVTIQQGGTQAPLFLVHPAGGHAYCYVPVAGELGRDQPCFGFQSVWRDGSPAHTTITQMASRYLEELRAHHPRGPYRIGGWSSGGVIAFEMARQLAETGPPPLLLLLDAAAPRPAAHSGLSEDAALLRVFAAQMNYPVDELGITGEAILALAPEQRPHYLARRARDAGLNAPEIEPDWFGRLHAMFRNNVRAAQAYRPQPYAGSACLFVAADPVADGSPEDLGWAGVIAHLSVHRLAGAHFTMLQKPYVRELARQIAMVLATPS